MAKVSKKTTETLAPLRKSKGLAIAAKYSGIAARNDKQERMVPHNWAEYAQDWLEGYDGK